TKAVPRQKFVYILIESLLGREIAKREELGKRASIETRVEISQFEERLDFRRKGEPVANHREIEGLDTQPVSRAEEAVVSCVPDGKREHAAKVPNAVIAIFFVQVDDRHLRGMFAFAIWDARYNRLFCAR